MKCQRIASIAEEKKSHQGRLRAFSLFIIAKPFDRNSSSVFDISGPLARLEDQGAAALLSAMVVYSITGGALLLRRKGKTGVTLRGASRCA